MTGTLTDGGPAFPIHHPLARGMSLRDWFAGQALAGWLANPNTSAPTDMGVAEAVSKASYAMAAAMLAAKEKEGTFLDKIATLKDIFAPEKEGGDTWDEMDKMLRVADRLAGRQGERSIVAELVANSDKIGAMIRDLRPQMLPAPSGPAQTNPPPGHEKSLDEFMTAVKTAHDAIVGGVEPEKVAPLIREKCPRVYEWLRSTDPAGVVAQGDQMLGAALYPDAQKDAHCKHALAQFKALAAGAGAGWVQNFLTEVKK